MNFLQQQAKFDDFIDEFNNETLHEALGMRYPGEIYTTSPRVYRGYQALNIHSTIEPYLLPTEVGSAWGKRR